MNELDWQLFKTAPRNGGEIQVTRRLGTKPFRSPHNIFKWDSGRECWLQKINDEWHRQLFDPTHWRTPPAQEGDKK